MLGRVGGWVGGWVGKKSACVCWVGGVGKLGGVGVAASVSCCEMVCNDDASNVYSRVAHTAPHSPSFIALPSPTRHCARRLVFIDRSNLSLVLFQRMGLEQQQVTQLHLSTTHLTATLNAPNFTGVLQRSSLARKCICAFKMPAVSPQHHPPYPHTTTIAALFQLSWISSLAISPTSVGPTTRPSQHPAPLPVSPSTRR